MTVVLTVRLLPATRTVRTYYAKMAEILPFSFHLSNMATTLQEWQPALYTIYTIYAFTRQQQIYHYN